MIATETLEKRIVKDATLSLVLPVGNGAPQLTALVQDCLLIVPHYFTDFEIIVVDDGSHASTLQVAHELAAQHEPVMVLRRTTQGGYASALLGGIASARGEYILSITPEDHVSASELARMMPYLAEYAVVMGYRLHRPAARGLHRRLMRRLVNWLLATELRDPECRVSLMRTDVVRQMSLRATSALVHAEIYARARRQHAPATQVGLYDYMPTSEQPHSERWHVHDMLGEMLYLRRHMLRWPPMPVVAPAATQRTTARGSWPQKLVWGIWLAAAVRGIWLLVRRRAND
jgi:glycosyltransferase involved in cell wall biosynthesis